MRPEYFKETARAPNEVIIVHQHGCSSVILLGATEYTHMKDATLLGETEYRAT